MAVLKKLFLFFILTFSLLVEGREPREGDIVSVGNGWSYQLGKLLGQGTYGKVFEGTLLAPSADEVAVKLIQWEGRSMEELIEFIDNYDFIKRTQPQGFTKIYGVFESSIILGERYLAIVMERVPTSMDKMEVPRLEYRIELALKALQDLLPAIKFLKDNGRSHDDIKPSNILMRKNGEFILNDFDLSSRPARTSSLYSVERKKMGLESDLMRLSISLIWLLFKKSLFNYDENTLRNFASELFTINRDEVRSDYREKFDVLSTLLPAFLDVDPKKRISSALGELGNRNYKSSFEDLTSFIRDFQAQQNQQNLTCTDLFPL